MVLRKEGGTPEHPVWTENTFQREISQTVFPEFLGQHGNSLGLCLWSLSVPPFSSTRQMVVFFFFPAFFCSLSLKTSFLPIYLDKLSLALIVCLGWCGSLTWESRTQRGKEIFYSLQSGERVVLGCLVCANILHRDSHLEISIRTQWKSQGESCGGMGRGSFYALGNSSSTSECDLSSVKCYHQGNSVSYVSLSKKPKASQGMLK